jgi:xanthine dehydrogenase accessory factor
MFDEFFRTAHELMRAGKPFATATVVRAEKPTSGKPGDRAIITMDGTMVGWIGGSCAQPAVVREALRAMADDRSRLIRLSPEPGSHPAPDGILEVPMTCFSGGTLDIFIEPHQPRPRLLLVGSLPVAQALAHLGRALNYDVVAVDPGSSDAMAHADLIVRSLDEIATHVTPLTFAVIATHGEYDEPALTRVLSTDVPYIGLVASRKRGAAVLQALQHEGIATAALARIRFPAGLDILARRGDEIALGIMAEIVKTRRSLETLPWPDEAEAAERNRTSGAAADTSPATMIPAMPHATPADVAPEPEAGQQSSTSDVIPHGATPPRNLRVLPSPDGQAQEPAHAQDPRTTLPAASSIDPVCGMAVQTSAALHSFEQDGRTWYFCCGGCRARFARDPGKYRVAS